MNGRPEITSAGGLDQRKSIDRLLLRLAQQGMAICILLLTIGCAFSSNSQNQFSTIGEVVDDHAKQFIRDDGPGLAMAVIRNGGVVLERSYGMADIGAQRAVGPDTRFYLASVSKQITAMAVMLLHEAGQIKFDDRIVRIFPEAPETWSGITVHHLLKHQSGVIEYLELPATSGWTNQDVLDYVCKFAPEFTPGSEYKYSNSGYSLLAMLVERISGTPFETFVQERIFAPLGMSQSIVADESRPVVPLRAVGYWDDGKLHDYPLRTMGDGGIFSSLRDMETWVMALGHSSLVSPESLELAFTSHEKPGYGYGWFVGKLRGKKHIYHAGALVGYKTHVSLVQEDSLAVVVLSNGTFREEVTELVDQVLSFCLQNIEDIK